MSIEKNLHEIRLKVEEAAQRGKSNPENIQIIAVTKTIDTDCILEAIEQGIEHIGENKVQEILQKYDIIGNRATWHMIGHLQRNKVKYIIDKVDFIHSLDSYRLALEIEERAKAVGKVMNCLLQVNISGEDTKYGVEPEEAKKLIAQLEDFSHLHIRGLMTMAPFVENQEEARGCFTALKKLADDISNMGFQKARMDFLSMGMSNDYEVAIEEGANFVRIGSAIFGERNYNK